ncbi:MAG: B12-binding domain-containing radical SAM protein [Deltaproteobacteria bacterium]|nr:B12-binding domain-containing radical SAM protein [Deltaproteobacteria bacterium]
MRILLVSSNLHSQFPACFPNAVGALAAYLKRERYDVRTFHMRRKRDIKRLPGLIREARPDLVGVSAVTCEADIIPQVARMAKEWNPGVPVLVGGIHGIVVPQRVLATEGVDGVCVGEGELAFHDYLRLMESSGDVTAAKNFMFRRNGGIVRNDSLEFIQNLDSLPFLDRSVTDYQQVLNANNGAANLIFSRGCPWSCAFCCNKDLRKTGRGEYARLMTPERAIEELAFVSGSYRFKYIVFRDDTFTWNKDWALKLLDLYAGRFTYPYDIFTRADCLDDEIVDRLKRTGCRHVFLGLDSGNDHIRNEILHKEQPADAILRAAEMLKARGIRPVISNIVGLPHETPRKFKDTIEINKRIYEDMVVFSACNGACPKIWVFEPWPGTDLFKLCEKNGWINDDNGGHRVYRESVLRLPGFAPDEIEREYRNFRYQVYKDHFPVQALLFRLYDTRLMQSVFENIPLEVIGKVREFVLSMMNSAVLQKR